MNDEMKKMLQEVIDKSNEKLEKKIDAKFKNQQKNLEGMFGKMFEKAMEPLQEKVTTLESKVNAVEKTMNESGDISSRVCNLQLTLIPVREKENLNDVYRALASKLGYDSPPDARVRRFKGPDDNKRPILITFASEFYKNEFLHRYRSRHSEMKLSLLPGFTEESRFYMQHDFTTTQYQLYKAAQKLQKGNELLKVAVQQGNRIMIQLTADDKFTFFPDAAALNAEIERRKSEGRVGGNASSSSDLKKN